MPLSDLLIPGGALIGLRAPTKKAFLQLLAEAIAPAAGASPHAVLDALLERERLGTTGFGDGTAIPHGRLEGLKRPLGLVVRLDAPVEYDSIDGIPVDLAFVLLTPLDQGTVHLKALASVSRALRDRALVAKLRGAGSADAVLAILGEAPQTRAA